MDFDYFDMIGCGDSFIFPLLGIIFSPVLFPLYLILKLLFAFLDFLGDVFESLFSKKNESKKEEPVLTEEQKKNIKKEELERKIEELKREKKRVEERIRMQESELSSYSLPINEQNQEEQESNQSMTLQLK